MIQDIFVPSKIGSYYIFHKRVVGFEITSSAVQASLIYFSKNKVVLENSMSIALQDQNPTSIINAIKKIATTIGAYDEVVTSLTSSAVIFKELTLPFIGRQKIAMIVNYEVEPLLPFSLDEAVIDFLIVEENKEKSQTTILVAATRKTDLQAYTNYFEKAGVQLTNVTLDMFALYDFYRNTMYVTQAYTSILLVDFGVDAIRILYIQKGILKSVRLVPYGLTSMMSKVDETFQLLPNKSVEDLFDKDVDGNDEETKHQIVQQLIVDFCKQISLSISFFQKQIKNFEFPSRVICLGAGSQLQGFLDQATEICQINFENLDIKRVAMRNNIQTNKKTKIDPQQSASLIIPLSAAHYGHINFLSYEQQKMASSLLNKQLLTALCISLAAIAGLYFYSNFQVKGWNISYEKSRKELITTLKDQMDIEVKAVKRVTDIVGAAQSKLQQTKKVCISYSRSNNSFLNHLQALCSKIDRASLGLDLKKLSLHDKEIVLQGKVKDYDALQTFEEELMDLTDFILKDRPQELTFTVTLQVKEDQDNNEG
ncbi:pilus assembly protein PilM [Candidatus Babeliales bacterium]|nr:pilus assembly protein PilM [Candidatus Babeliales bacterium]MBP9843369.1 pilus assembly protein PilM [Candidatus Babeliales bacterium]